MTYSWSIWSKAQRKPCRVWNQKQQHLIRKAQWKEIEARRDLIWVKEHLSLIRNTLLDASNALDHEYKTNLPKQRLSRDSQHRSWDGYNWTIV